MSYVPERGHILHLKFDSSSDQGESGRFFALALSSKDFNRRGLVMVCPISQGVAASARTYGTVVTLMGSGTATQGAIHCHQLKSLDWMARKASFKEAVPEYVLDEVNARVQAILFDG